MSRIKAEISSFTKFDIEIRQAHELQFMRLVDAAADFFNRNLIVAQLSRRTDDAKDFFH